MKSLAFLGKLMYALAIGASGVVHFLKPNAYESRVPDFLPLPILFVYLTGAALIAAGISIIINKKAQLGALLLGIMLILFAVLVHLPGGNPAMPLFLRDIALAGAAFVICANAND